jgi:hypothetical protein
MMINLKQPSRLLFAAILTSLLAACGGGGGGAQVVETPVTPETALVNLTSNVVLLDSPQQALVSVGATGDTFTLSPSTAGTTPSVQPGNAIHIPAGVDSRFPLGLSVVAQTVSVGANGIQTINVQPATELAQIATGVHVHRSYSAKVIVGH